MRRLRMVAVVLALVFGLSGFSPVRALEPLPAEVKAVEMVKARGGLVDFGPEGKVTKVDLSDRPATDADILVLESLGGLESLELWGAEVTNAGMPNVAKLTGLKTLVLENTDVNDAGLAPLVGLGNLKVLNLRRSSNMSDAALATASRPTWAFHNASNSSSCTTISPTRAWRIWRR